MMKTQWSFKPVALILLGIFLLILGLIFQFYGLEAIMYQNLQKNSILLNGSTFYEHWSKPETGYIRVYIFNVTNPDEVIQGEEAVLEEVGPYVYDYTVTKIDLEEIEYDNLQYRLSYLSQFNVRLSKKYCSEMDQVTIMHYPLISTILAGLAFGQDIMNTIKSATAKIFPHHESPFITASVREILFDGIALNCSSRSHLVYLICRQLTIQGSQFFWLDEHLSTRFALLHSKNVTSLDFYNVHTGAEDVNQRGGIRKFRNESSLSHWKNRFCNRLNGSSDGSNTYPTHLTPNSRLYYFEANFGRSVFADFTESKILEDMRIFRFEANEKLFRYEEENFCFCPRGIAKTGEEHDPVNCPPNGLLNLALFSYVPLMISFPWFLYGSPELRDILPNTSTHRQQDLVTFIEIEPVTGVPIRGAKRIQFNLILPQVSNFEYLSRVQERLFPSIWVEQVSQNDQSSIDKVKNALFELQVYQGFIYGAMACGLMLTLVFSIVLIIHNKKLQRTEDENIRAISLTQKEENRITNS